jgi:molybdate transport system ATP-binding protein
MSTLAAHVTVIRGAFRLEAALSASGGITTILGPSGAGKTTLLLALLGDIAPAAGVIELGGRTLFDADARTNVPVRERRIGIVFQDALLFPHLDARANVAFGARRADPPEPWLERVGASALAARRPKDLSGGERQRVARARARAARPKALLLDEPFSALDSTARTALGTLLVELQRQTHVPFLHVTHDPAEALRLSDTAIAIDGGRVVAEGPTSEILAGKLLGADNWLKARVLEDGLVDLGGTIVVTRLLGRAPGDTVVLALSADDVVIARGEIHGTSARNVIAGEVLALHDREGGIDVTVGTPVPLRAHVTRASVAALGLARGTRVWLLVKANAFRLEG